MAPVAQLANNLLTLFTKTHKMTMELVSTLEQDDYVIQTATFTSPPKWHIGHTSWVYEMVMSKIDSSYIPTKYANEPYLNSYYNQAGKILPKSERGNYSRPTTAEMMKYFKEIDTRLCKFISSCSLDSKLTQLLLIAINHETQHQELLMYDLQHMLASKYSPKHFNTPPISQVRFTPKSVPVQKGLYEIGYTGDAFCYDIESPSHKVYLEDYDIDVFPVTCEQYIEFMDDDGYEDYRYWLSDGWDAVQSNSWNSPLYWYTKDGKWFVDDFVGPRPVNIHEPVCHVSYYEADAYCRWARKRLPTEAEWEIAACYDPATKTRRLYPWSDTSIDATHANLLESRLWRGSDVGSYGVGASPIGCEHMIGDVWEWTSSEFCAYPGFVSGFDEYNDKWFGNQKVLRGGSFATPVSSIRSTSRNFFRPDERWMFAGFRCATLAHTTSN